MLSWTSCCWFHLRFIVHWQGDNSEVLRVVMSLNIKPEWSWRYLPSHWERCWARFPFIWGNVETCFVPRSAVTRNLVTLYIHTISKVHKNISITLTDCFYWRRSYHPFFFHFRPPYYALHSLIPVGEKKLFRMRYDLLIMGNWWSY